MSRERRLGLAAALGAAALFGLVNVAGRFVLGQGVPPLWTTAFYYLGGALALAPFALRTRLAREDRPRLAVMVVAGAIVAPILLFYGLSVTTAVNVSLLMNLEMAFTGALAFLLLRERLGGLEAFGIALLVAGAVTVSLAGAEDAAQDAPLWGALFVVGAAFCWAVDNIASTPLSRRYDPRGLIGLKTLLGGAAIVTLAPLLLGPPTGSVTGWLVALLAGALGVALSSVLFYAALARIGATRTTALFGTSALTGAGAAVLLLDEPFTRLHVVAALLVVAGILLVARHKAAA